MNKLQVIQGRCLRAATGAYEATATEALGIETRTLPIGIFLATLVARTLLHLPNRRLRRRPKQQQNEPIADTFKTGETSQGRKDTRPEERKLGSRNSSKARHGRKKSETSSMRLRRTPRDTPEKCKGDVTDRRTNGKVYHTAPKPTLANRRLHT
jgi:hypothetical protein